VSNDKTPIEKAVDLAVYAPIGFFNFIRTMMPGWIEGGRQEVAKQMTNARAISEIAIAQGRKEAEKAVAQTGEVVSNLAARRQQQQQPPAPRPTATPTPTAAPTAATTPSSSASPPATSNGPRPNGDALAIPGYDSLAASQVVQRLGGLSSTELEAVRNYEEATRGRRTILNRIGQLQAETNQ
jgi:hypothetical protein